MKHLGMIFICTMATMNMESCQDWLFVSGMDGVTVSSYGRCGISKEYCMFLQLDSIAPVLSNTVYNHFYLAFTCLQVGRFPTLPSLRCQPRRKRKAEGVSNIPSDAFRRIRPSFSLAEEVARNGALADQILRERLRRLRTRGRKALFLDPSIEGSQLFNERVGGVQENLPNIPLLNEFAS